MSAKILAVAMAVLCGAPGVAAACQKHSNPVFQDDFKNADPGWGQPDNVAAFTANGLVLTPPVSGSAWRTNANLTMAQGDWCIEVVNPSTLPTVADEDSVGSVGAWFWGTDRRISIRRRSRSTATHRSIGSIGVSGRSSWRRP